MKVVSGNSDYADFIEDVRELETAEEKLALADRYIGAIEMAALYWDHDYGVKTRNPHREQEVKIRLWKTDFKLSRIGPESVDLSPYVPFDEFLKDGSMTRDSAGHYRVEGSLTSLAKRMKPNTLTAGIGRKYLRKSNGDTYADKTIQKAVTDSNA